MQRKGLKILGVVLMSTMLFNIYAISALAALHNYSLEESNANAETIIQDMKIKYLQNGIKPNGEAIEGIGWDNSGEVEGSEAETGVLQLKENIIGAAALYKDFQARSDASSESWARTDMYLKIRGLRSTSGTTGYSSNQEMFDNVVDRKFAIDQFMFLEFASECFEISDDSNQYSDIQNNYRDTEAFKAQVNSSLFNDAPFGAYWTIIGSNEKYPQPTDGNEKTIYNPFPEDNIYPLTNVSLWAAAGIAHFAHTQQIRDDPDEYVEEARTDAEMAFAYANIYAWNTTLGLYHEEQSRSLSRNFRSNTQVVGLLACARLYQLFQEDIYLIKANEILNSIMKYFWVPGLGGITESLGSTLVEGQMTGFDNALFAYGLIQLAIATGAENTDFGEFLSFSRPENEYARIAMTVMKFMNNYLWLLNEAKTVAGYAEYVLTNGTLVEKFPYTEHSRFAITNMLALYNLASIIEAEKSWWAWNVEYLTYTGAVLGVIILVAIIVIKKRSAGSKLPKVVKGLLGDED